MSALPSEALARRLAELADSKKAEDIVLLDMRGLVSYTDFLVICTARNERQARAIVDEVQGPDQGRDRLCCRAAATARGRRTGRCSTTSTASSTSSPPEARDRYQLEDLWREAPRLELDLDSPEAPSAASA